MCGWLVILFTVVPALEIYLLMQVGAVVGGVNTVLLVIMTGVVGAYYARQQGFAVINRFQDATAQGRIPGDALFDGALILIGSTLLITPGIVTDGVGLSLLLPPTRNVIKRVVGRWLQGKIDRGEIQIRKH